MNNEIWETIENQRTHFKKCISILNLQNLSNEKLLLKKI